MDGIDKFLDKIEKESDYALLGNCFCLQGNPDLKLFRVKPIEEVYEEAFLDFSMGISCPFVTIGISPDEHELWRMKAEMVDNEKREFSGNIIIDDGLRVIEGEPIRNEITINKLYKMYDHNLAMFRMNLNRNWVLLGVATSPKIAKQHVITVRVFSRRPENPKKGK